MDKSKRNLAKVLGVAGAGAAVWKKPIVDSVSLPVHASTTSSCSGGCFEGAFNEVPNDQFVFFDPNTGVLSYHQDVNTCSNAGFVIDEYAIAETAEDALIVNPSLACANFSVQAGACTIWFCAG